MEACNHDVRSEPLAGRRMIRRMVAESGPTRVHVAGARLRPMQTSFEPTSHSIVTNTARRGQFIELISKVYSFELTFLLFFLSLSLSLDSPQA
eukprot:2272311-Prymnesium_polylepis.2